MELFGGSELAFCNAYFAPISTNTIKINTDLPVKTLISPGVSPSAGSFAYPERGLQNRFILWRADGSNLYIDEYSIDRELIGSSLCINFSHSLIIPGTRIFIVRNKFFLLIVPTQSGIHRFFVPLERNQDDSLGDQSLISRLHQSGDLLATHDFHAWKFVGIAIKVSIGTDRNGLIVAAACMMDRQLIRIIFPPLSPMATVEADEVILQGVGMLNRIFLKQIVETWDMTVAVNETGQLRIFNLSRDGKIRIFDINSTTMLSCVDLTELIPKWSVQIVDATLKSVPMGKGSPEMFLIHMVVSENSHFVLLQQHRERLSVFYSTTLGDAYIKDFICTIHQSTNKENEDKYCLWAIVNESVDSWSQDEDCQPYTLKKCEFVDSPNAKFNWEIVRAATTSGAIDNLLFKYPDSEGIRNKIFDSNNYSFDVVNRAVQIVCKQPQKHIEYGNWLGLSKHLDDFLASGQFKQVYMANGNDGEGDAMLDYGLLREDNKLRIAYEKFWFDFQKTCNQLQEERLAPLALWHSSTTGLTGVIQMCRFTVHCPPDEQLRAICSPDNKVAKELFELMRPNKQSNFKDPEKTLELINNNINELCRLIIAIATNISPVISLNVLKSRSPYLNSQFTVALVSMALRNLILARLKAAWIINGLSGAMPQILAISSESRMNPKLDMVIGAYKGRIAQLINHYTTMWIALSVRLISHDPIPKQINVAQAFLNQSIYFRRSNHQGRLGGKGEDDDDDGFGEENTAEIEMLDTDEVIGAEGENEDEERGEEEDVLQRTLPPPSRWDDTFMHQLHRTRHTQFSRFFMELIDGMLTVFWPESHRMMLPRFLAESRFFDALRNYCSLNEPFSLELSYAFRFFQAIAHSGQNKPGIAWTIFEEVSNGIIAGDSVLNELLTSMYPSASIFTGKRRSSQAENSRQKHSLIEYFHKVMFIFKEHKHPAHVVMAGDRAIKFVKDGDALLLSEVYITLFTQHLVAKDYLEAIRAIFLNPVEKRQSVCLRQLVTHLLDTRQTQVLVALPYDHLVDIVVDILEVHCKMELEPGPMYNIAYAFLVSRCEYERAAKLMYELSMRLRREIQNSNLLQKRCNVLATVYQTMQIVEQQNTTEMVINVDMIEYKTADHVQEGSGNGPQDNGVEDDFAMIEINEQEQAEMSAIPIRNFQQQIKLADVARELLKAEARLALIDADESVVPPQDEEDILRKSLRHKRYDMAWLLIKEFELKTYDLLDKITEESIRIDYDKDFYLEENEQQQIELDQSMEPDWILCNRNFIRDYNTGGHQKSHWRIVISYLDLAMKLFPYDTAILRCMANCFLKFSIKLPNWLLQRYMKTNFADLLRTLLDYGDLDDAFKLLFKQIHGAKVRLQELLTKQIRKDPMAKIAEEDLALLLPYTHIEILLQMAEKSEERNQLPIEEALKRLKEFNDYQRTMTRNPINA